MWCYNDIFNNADSLVQQLFRNCDVVANLIITGWAVALTCCISHSATLLAKVLRPIRTGNGLLTRAHVEQMQSTAYSEVSLRNHSEFIAFLFVMSSRYEIVS